MLDLDPGARRLGELGLGLNPGIDRFTGSILFDEKIGGTVHLALGQSYPETGGRQQFRLALGPDRRHEGQRPDLWPTAGSSWKTDNGWSVERSVGWHVKERRLTLMIRATSNEGPDHATRFRSSVSGSGLVASGFLRAMPDLAARGQADRGRGLATTVCSSSSTASTRAKAEAREAATASLIKLGPKILPLLPDTATVPSRQAQGPAREASARPCAESEDDINTGASRVTIKGKGIRLTEALRQLQKQTGNAITDLREQLGAEVTNPALDLEIRDKPFFEALDQIARQAEVTTELLHRRRLGRHHGRRASRRRRPIQYSGPFRIDAQADRRGPRLRRPAPPPPPCSSKPPGSRGSARCS